MQELFCPQAVGFGDVATWFGAIGSIVAVAGSALLAYQTAHREIEQVKAVERQKINERQRNVCDVLTAVMAAISELTEVTEHLAADDDKFDIIRYEIKLLRESLEPLTMEMPSQKATEFLLTLLRLMYQCDQVLVGGGAVIVAHGNALKIGVACEQAYAIASCLRDEIIIHLPEAFRRDRDLDLNSLPPSDLHV